MTDLKDLPEELIVEILHYLDLRDLRSIRCVNEYFKRLSHTAVLWIRAYKRCPMVPADVLDPSSPQELESVIYYARKLYRQLCLAPTCKSGWILPLPTTDSSPLIALSGSGRYLVLLRPGRGFLCWDINMHLSWEVPVDPWPPADIVGGIDATEITWGSQYGIAIAIFLAPDRGGIIFFQPLDLSGRPHSKSFEITRLLTPGYRKLLKISQRHLIIITQPSLAPTNETSYMTVYGLESKVELHLALPSLVWDVAVYDSLLFFVLGKDDTHIGMCDLRRHNTSRDNHHVSRIKIPDVVPSSVQFPRHARSTATGQPLIHIHALLKPSDPRRVTGMARLAVTPHCSSDGPPSIEWLESIGPQPYKVQLFDRRGWRMVDPSDVGEIDILNYAAGHVWSVAMLSVVRSNLYALVLSHADANGVMRHRRIEVHDPVLASSIGLAGMLGKRLVNLLFDEALGRIFVCTATVDDVDEAWQSPQISINVLEF